MPAAQEFVLPAVRDLLNTLKLEDEYKERLETLRFFGFTESGDKPVPAYEAVARSFTREEVELAQTFQEPALLLVPECSFARKVTAMNGKKTMDRQVNCYVNGIYTEPADAKPEITGWKAMIVDGAAEMALKPGDGKGATLKDRIAARKAARKKKADGSELERGLERDAWAMLMMESLRRKIPINKQKFWSFCFGSTIFSVVPSMIIL